MSRRTFLALAGWLAAAVLATAVGVTAVQLIGSGFAGGGTDVLTPQQVADQLAAAAPTSSPSVTPSPSVNSGPSGEPGERRVLSGPGGTVVASCVDGLAFLVSWTPAQGYAVKRYDRGPYEHAEVRFEGSAGRSEVRVRCANGEPTAQWTG